MGIRGFIKVNKLPFLFIPLLLLSFQNCSGGFTGMSGAFGSLKSSMFSDIAGATTFGNDVIQLTATPRLAGSIEFLTFNGKQFLDNYDHGREMETAFWNNGKGGCENPTQAGNADDATGSTSTSVLLNQSSTSNSYTSTVWPAYWFEQGEACDGSGGNTVVSNTASDQPLTTEVTVGVDGDPQVIHYVSTIQNQYAHSSMIVSSGLAMTSDFNASFVYNTKTKQVEPIDVATPGMVWQQFPPIVSTGDGKYAVGLVAGNQNGVTASFSISENGVAGMNLVLSYGALPSGALTQEEYIIVGTLDDVTARMPGLYKKVHAASVAASTLAPAPSDGSTSDDDSSSAAQAAADAQAATDAAAAQAAANAQAAADARTAAAQAAAAAAAQQQANVAAAQAAATAAAQAAATQATAASAAAAAQAATDLQTAQAAAFAARAKVVINRYVGPGGRHLFARADAGSVPAQFSLEGAVFNLYTTQYNSTTALYRCNTSSHQFLSTDGGCEGQTVVSQMGYISTVAVSGSSPLYRMHTPQGDYIEANDQSVVSEGYSLDGSLGFSP